MLISKDVEVAIEGKVSKLKAFSIRVPALQLWGTGVKEGFRRGQGQVAN
jgi:hypothetical protein